jgi:hypothetical protein
MAYTGYFSDDLTKSLLIGFLGNLSSANFIIQHSGFEAGTALSLGVAVDTGVHILEMWGNGSTTIYGRIDGGATVSAVQSAALVNAATVAGTCKNGTDAVNRSLDVDFVLWIGDRRP